MFKRRILCLEFCPVFFSLTKVEKRSGNFSHNNNQKNSVGTNKAMSKDRTGKESSLIFRTWPSTNEHLALRKEEHPQLTHNNSTNTQTKKTHLNTKSLCLLQHKTPYLNATLLKTTIIVLICGLKKCQTQTSK